MPFDCAHISNLHSIWPCQVPPDFTIQCHPLPLPHSPYFHPLCRHSPLTIHNTCIRLKTCPIPIYISFFEACLLQYVEYSMVVLGDMVLPERVELVKVRKESNISSLLVFWFSKLFLYFLASSRMFESDSILIKTWQKILTTHSSVTGWIHHPPDRENINIFNGSRHMKGDTKYFH